MRVTFYGVRGSIPAPGPSTARYGGNTSCVEVRLADGTLVVLDAGTGLRELGNALLRNGSGVPGVHLLLSHTHWDHILGLPFFAPLWMKGTHILVYPLSSDAQERFRATIFDDIHFPVGADAIPSHVESIRLDGEAWRVGSALIRRIALNHPGGAQGFRIDDDGGSSLAYLTDNELTPPQDATVTPEALARFADGVDLLIHDSQYVRADMPSKHGWGHSVVDDVLALGTAARPKTLALYHHDPERSDDALDAIGKRAQSWLAEHAPGSRVVVAHEGLKIEI
jgi:phosphoribosyl 1,2-cyclic phosphodiesterase